MATVRPARNYWDARATAWCYFDAVTGTQVEHNTSMLVIATDNTNPAAATYYSAIKFDAYTGDEPDWTSEGPIAWATAALLVTLAQISKRIAGIGVIQWAKINATWDDSYTAAQMRGLSISGWQPISGLLTRVGRPEQWALTSSTGAGTAYGYMFRVEPGYATQGGSCRLFTEPAPIMRHFYGYSPTTATRSDATERSTLSAAALSVLNSEAAPRYFEVSADILTSEVLPAETDTELTITAGSDAAEKVREMSWPESWQLDIPSAGALSVSLVSDTLSSTLRGMPVESQLDIVFPDGSTETIGKQTQFIGDITFRNDGTGEIELRSPIDSILNALVTNYSAYGSSTVNYDAELAPYIIADAMMNSGKLLYKRIHYNDIVYLLRRFVGVFSPLTYSVADLIDKTVSTLLDEIGPLYAIALAQSGTGCVGFFHPAVYRPSLRVWTIDEDDCIPGGYSVIDRGRDGQYGAVRITDTGTPADDTTIYFPGALPSQPGQLEDIYDFTAQGAVFTNLGYTPARNALGTQLSQRLCASRIECELQLGLKGLAIECGDIVKLTGAGLDDTTRFLIYSVQGSSTTGQVTVKGVHYPDCLSLTNTFEDDGILGEWRWLDETGSQDTSNTAPNGTDDDPTTCTLATLSYDHWQGAMHDEGYVGWEIPLIDAAKHDVIDVCTMLSPEIDANVGNIASWGDDTYMPIMAWFKSGGTGVECMAVGFYRPGYSGSEDIVTDRLFVAHIDDYTAGSFSFATAVVYSPNGIAGRDSSQTGEVPAAFALQWDDDGNVNLYVDRQLVGSGSGYSKADWDSFRIMTQEDIKIGCVRHLQTTTAITEVQRLQGLNGLDPYQP